MSGPGAGSGSGPGAGSGSRVLVVGETVVDVVERDGSRSEHVGGSPATVAVALSRLGRSVRFATALGDDERGRRARAHLEEAGVAVSAPARGTTSTAAAVIGADGSARYEFDLSWDPDRIDPDGAVHLHTGSIAAFLHPGADAVADLLDRLPPRTSVSLDPNIRPEVLPARAEVHRVLERLLRRCDLVKLSDEDAEWLHPGDSVDAVLDRLLAAGPSLAIVTRGGEGMVLASRRARVVVPASRITVADTIGAGDTAMAGLIDALLDSGTTALDEDALLAAGRWAARAAGVTASRIGADPPFRAELAGV
ncbi:carbohydrate kinase [Rathayibacter sp. AY1F3]|uniref:PfkB family carbohydrate kinase n=1 Tax=Rathayibacter sp. AY1F3 TaxID=2080558 RepID=UPI000CE849A5|nr:PfkB family carbohydrate kinase [Rathayibacter sp. AY1F3]PPG92937.1 carbohydrate kinase [Rathayibacter sp. AY1F3]